MTEKEGNFSIFILFFAKHQKSLLINEHILEAEDYYGSDDVIVGKIRQNLFINHEWQDISSDFLNQMNMLKKIVPACRSNSSCVDILTPLSKVANFTEKYC